MQNLEIPIGLCKQMCSPSEYHEREQQKRLSIFEVPSATYKNTPVKEFSRSAAGKEVNVDELRPANVLVDTMNYLFDEIVNRKDQPWSAIFLFVFDRIRAIRQDMVIQRIVDESAVEILEKAVRFHIFAHYKLKEESLENFDPGLNEIHLQECLKRILVLYDNQISSQNRAEFEMYYLLHNLGSNEALQRILHLPPNIKNDEFVKLSLELSLMKNLGNFVAVFRIAAKLPYLGRCLVAKHSARLRCSALIIMNTAFSIPNCIFPLSLLAKILAFESEHAAQEFVSSFGIEVEGSNIKFSKKSYVEPAKAPLDGSCSFLAQDLACRISEMLNSTSATTSTKKISVSTPLRVTVRNDQYRTVVPEPVGIGRGVNPADGMDSIQVKGRGRGRGRGRAINVLK